MATLTFRTAGESHGKANIALIEGLPAGLAIDSQFIDAELLRRQGGYGRGGRQQLETDHAQFITGTRMGRTIGSPVTILIPNKDSRLDDPAATPPLHRPRPGHADLAGSIKWLTTDCREILERASARETTARVAAGALSRCLLRQFAIEAFAFVRAVGPAQSSIEITAQNLPEMRSLRDASDVYCPDAIAAGAMRQFINDQKTAKDTAGGIVETHIFGLPPGLGSCMTWDGRLDSRIAAAVVAIQAFKGVEFGLGFEAVRRPGSRVHDEIAYDPAQRDLPSLGFVRPTNNAGGIEGGMTNGQPVVVRAAMKPISTLGKPLHSIDLTTLQPSDAGWERSDISAIAAASVIMENVVAFEIARAFVEKFAGDTMTEIKNSYEAYLASRANCKKSGRIPNMPQVTADQMLKLGLAHHNAGRLDEAIACYQRAAELQPLSGDAHFNLGIAWGQKGQIDNAIACFHRAVGLYPQFVEGHYNLGTAWMERGNFNQAVACFRKAIALRPDYADAHNNLGNSLLALGQLDQAVECHRKVILLRPEDAVAYCNLGGTLSRKGQPDQAVTCFQRAIALRPDLVEAHIALGVSWYDQGQIDQAVACYQAALTLNPGSIEALCNLGNICNEKQDFDQAVAFFQRALRAKPDCVQAHIALGTTTKMKGDLDAAIACYQRALTLDPNSAEACNDLGIALGEKGLLDQAIANYQRALVLKPDLAEAHANLGDAWMLKGQFDQAVACYQRALAIKPSLLPAHDGLARAWKDQGDLDQAITCYRQALAIDPDSARTHNNLGNAQKDAGLLDDAIASYRRALSFKPDFVSAHDNLLYALPFHPDCNPQSLFAEFQTWNRRHAAPLKRFIQHHADDRDPDRRLRIGYVSPDFRSHPVGRFILPLLAAHDRAALEVFCYAQVPVPDKITAAIQSHADAWRSIIGLSDERTAQLIRDDRIDILVDLSMHMGDNRLLVFARKPAPVQVTYLAYAGGTALDTIDYRLTDRHLDPDPDDDKYYMEKSVRLAGTYWCYQQNIATQPLNQSPLLTSGTITFGCLNNFSKVSRNTLETWAGLLNQLPDSRLVLHAIPGAHRDRLIRFLADRGIAPRRLEFVGWISSAEKYFQTYHRIDIALDPFPYAGGTTTCDALWMGVPVVTLAGRIGVARAGVSILSNAGLPELIAQTPEQYIHIAAGLAADPTRLADLRATLRQRLQASPLMDAARFARDVQAAYRTMWRAWCAT